MSYTMFNFPRQMLSFRKKNKEWRKQCVLWGDSRSFFSNDLVRKSLVHKKINYDLMDGKLHMDDVALVINPDSIKANFVPEHIQHYAIINSKLGTLIGEESERPFDYRVIVTNPNAISEIEETKKELVFADMLSLIQDTSLSEEDFTRKVGELEKYYTYHWQDIREIWGNEVLNHYTKELRLPLKFVEGFRDALICGEELYQVDIVGGEPVVKKLNPLHVSAYRSGYSSDFEDADVVVIEDYWSPSEVIDTFYDELTKKDVEYLEHLSDPSSGARDSYGNYDDRYSIVNPKITEEAIDFGDYFGTVLGVSSSLLPFDVAGNVRVMRVYWKSRRKILKVKQYDPETGEVMYNFYPENYIPDDSLGEEATSLWINEAWEGTMIGGHRGVSDFEDDTPSGGIFVQMRPRPVQYNRLSNPSRCHFGIIGSVYNLNGGRPFSMVDMMKPYNYLFDVIHYRLNEAIASTWGDILEMDFAYIPKGWDIEKWMYYAKINHIAVKDSLKEITKGAATGKVAASFGNNSKGMISSNTGNYIQQLVNLLEVIKLEMSEVVGITKQREGQIANRETVGGVERAVMQSSYITEYYFKKHEDVKKRVLECLLETIKVCKRGGNIKFQYITSDLANRTIDIDGDVFAECDYGLLIDNSNNVSNLDQKLETMAQAALQNQALDLSAIIKLYQSGMSLAQKVKIIEDSEAQRKQEAQEQQMVQQQMQEQQLQATLEQRQMEMEHETALNEANNQTKILVAQITAQGSVDVASIKSQDGIEEPEFSEEAKANLMEKIREFDLKLQHDYKKLSFEKEKHKDDVVLKKRALTKKNTKKV